MKRSAFLTLCMCLLMLSFSGCYRYPMPDPNPDNIWVSDDPEISFVYFDAGEPCKGKMNIDGNIIEIEIYFDYSNQMFIHPIDEELRNDGSNGRLLLGHIEMIEDQIIYSIYWRKDNIWEGIDTITFHREVIDASEQPDAVLILIQNEPTKQLLAKGQQVEEWPWPIKSMREGPEAKKK